MQKLRAEDCLESKIDKLVRDARSVKAFPRRYDAENHRLLIWRTLGVSLDNSTETHTMIKKYVDLDIVG